MTVSVCVINMDVDVDRLDHMREQLARLDLSWKRFPAIVGCNLPTNLRAVFPSVNEGPLTAGEIGCYASHLQVLEMIAAAEEGDVFCVMEDDLKLSKELADLFKNIKKLPSDWEIIRLSNSPKSGWLKRANLNGVGDVVSYWRIPTLAGAYLINRSGARKILAKPGKRLRAIDDDLRRDWQFGIKTYGILPPPVATASFKSSIDSIAARPQETKTRRFRSTYRESVVGIHARLNEFGISGAISCIAQGLSLRLKRKLVRS